MLSSFERGIITLINNALKSENKTLPEDFDYSKVYNFGVKHQILPLLYYGGAGDQKFMASDIGNKMLYAVVSLIAISENQLYEIDKLCKEFDKNGIEYLKLKGSILKRLYPKVEMRLMSDADILIKEDKRSEAEKVMSELEYTFVQDSDHEIIWKNHAIQIELHKRIIATYQKDFYEYFGDGWKLAHKKSEDSFEYVMSLEDEFIYLFTHLAKHYREAGIGIKHMTDIYLFLSHYPELNLDYVYNELEKLKLLEFYKNVKRTLDVWFNDTEWDEISEFITAKIFESGVYGTKLAYIKAEAVRLSKGRSVKRARSKKKLALAFPPYKKMCNIFPALKKAPILLPFLWIWRLIKAVLFKRKKIGELNSEVDSYSQEEIDECRAELDFVGLDFNFEV